MNKTIIFRDGDEWTVLGRGRVDIEAGTQLCHLASNTRFRHQKNGRVPVQIMDWIPLLELDGE